MTGQLGSVISQPGVLILAGGAGASAPGGDGATSEIIAIEASTEIATNMAPVITLGD